MMPLSKKDVHCLIKWMKHVPNKDMDVIEVGRLREAIKGLKKKERCLIHYLPCKFDGEGVECTQGIRITDIDEWLGGLK